MIVRETVYVCLKLMNFHKNLLIKSMNAYDCGTLVLTLNFGVPFFYIHSLHSLNTNLYATRYL